MLNAYGESSPVATYGPALLRVAVGGVFIAHGAQKLFGIWGGSGLAGTAAFLDQLGFGPAFPLAVLAGVVEFGAGILLVLGAFTMLAALVLVVEMAIAVWAVHLPHGFFLPAGYEYNLVLIAAMLCLMLTGPGAMSIDSRRASHAAAAAAGRARLRAGKV